MKKNDSLLTTILPLALAGAVIGVSACASDPINPDDHQCPVDPTETTTSGGEGGAGGATTTDATTTTGSGTTSTGSGMSEEFNPQEVAAKLHGCRKLRFQSLGNLLIDRGVDIQSFGGSQSACQTDVNGPFCAANEQCYCPAPPCVQVGNENGNDGICVAAPATPGFLYRTATDAFSFPQIDSRTGEKDGHSTASAMRLFDIFVQASSQIIANIQDPQLAPACVRQGQTFPMFDPGRRHLCRRIGELPHGHARQRRSSAVVQLDRRQSGSIRSAGH